MNKELVVSNSFLESCSRFDGKSQKIVYNSIKQLAIEDKGTGFQIHDLSKAKCDKSFRSARVNRDIRLIFSHQGDKYILLYVDHHDNAYDWVEGKFLRTNDFGALFVYDTNVQIEDYHTELEASADLDYFNEKVPLLEKQGIKIKDLIKLGINEVHAEYLIKISSEDKFLEFISLFPEEIKEALLDLVVGTKSLTEIYAELTDDNVKDMYSDIDKALAQKDSMRRFYVLSNINELERILEYDFEKWKLFLHPKQEILVSSHFKGPVLIEGGPGTGKTVVGIHRAAYLSQNVYTLRDNKKILLCTFSRKLAGYLKDKVENMLAQNYIDNNVEVKGIDSLISELLNLNGIYTEVVGNTEIQRLLRDTYYSMNREKPLEFYVSEYEEVIQKYNIKSLEEYLKANRSGSGLPLNAGARKKEWEFFQVFLNKKKAANLVDFEDRAHFLNELLCKGQAQPIYDSIIVDEAQDLSPVKLKVLMKLVKGKNDSIMLLSDQNQRIFKLNSWRSDVKIDIVGRTFYLDLNYRTTKQIKDYAENQFIQSEIISKHIKNYKSIFGGPEPEILGFSNKEGQYSYVLDKINNYIKYGVKPHEICIITPKDSGKIVGILEYKNINATELIRDIFPSKDTGVCVSTLHGCKGLEFRIIIFINYTEVGKMFFEESYDQYKYKNILKQLECLKYVASTRAREELIVTYVE